jgi:hypothetical protein
MSWMPQPGRRRPRSGRTVFLLVGVIAVLVLMLVVALTVVLGASHASALSGRAAPLVAAATSDPFVPEEPADLPLRVGDCALALPTPTNGSLDSVVVTAEPMPCIVDMTLVVVSITSKPACDEGFVSALGPAGRRACLALYNAELGECLVEIATSDQQVPLPGVCERDDPAAVTVLKLVPRARTGVYGCADPHNAVYVSVKATYVACLSEPKGTSPI